MIASLKASKANDRDGKKSGNVERTTKNVMINVYYFKHIRVFTYAGNEKVNFGVKFTHHALGGNFFYVLVKKNSTRSS